MRDKGHQLAQRDAELGGEVLREINLLQTTWEDTKKLITERSGTVYPVLYCNIKMVICLRKSAKRFSKFRLSKTVLALQHRQTD